MVLVAYAGPVRPAAALRESVLCLPTDIHSLFVDKPSSSSSSSSSSASSMSSRPQTPALHVCDRKKRHSAPTIASYYKRSLPKFTLRHIGQKGSCVRSMVEA